jgi:hypothetical protein
MVRSRLGLKALGICAALLGLMAVTAGSAQAEPTAFWSVVSPGGTLTKITTEALLPEIQVKEIEELKDEKDPGKHAVLLTTIGAANTPIAILCTGAELENAAGTGPPKLLKEGSLLGKAKFTGCITKLKGATSAPCKPHSKGAAEGTILTELAKGLIKLHTLIIEEEIEKVKVKLEIKDDTVLLFPENSKGEQTTTFVTIILGVEGELNECSVGEKLPVEGELVITDCGIDPNKSFLEEKEDHLIEEFKGLQLLHFGLRPATIDGSAIVHLVGAHAGFKWAGTPG